MKIQHSHSSRFSLVALTSILSLAAIGSCSSGSSDTKLGMDAQNNSSAPSTYTNSNRSATSVNSTNSLSSEESSSTQESKKEDTALCQEGALQECSQLSNGQEVLFPGGVPRGNCKKGFRRCKNGAWTRCEGTVQPAAQDECIIAGDDANCNGIPNEQCACVASQEPRPCGVSDAGACTLGTQNCVDGQWQACQGEVKPRPEECGRDGVDEDCDGAADLDDKDCECVHGDEELCSIPAKGDCSFGKRVCNRGAWGECKPRFEKLDLEVCGEPRSDKFGQAPGDEDCDGKVDHHSEGPLAPVGCEHFMIDEDRDGFGAIGNNYAFDQTNYTYGCFCPNQLPNPSLVPGNHDRVNKDCGDCAVDGQVVNPRAHDFFEKPSSCLQELEWKGGAFDYNCDNSEERRETTIVTCEEKGNFCLSNSGYWDKSAPACGESGRVGAACLSSTPPCSLQPGIGLVIQGCR